MYNLRALFGFHPCGGRILRKGRCHPPHTLLVQPTADLDTPACVDN